MRNPDIPDGPTLAETGTIGADVPIWFGFYGPAGLPKEIVTKLIAKIVQERRFQEETLDR